MAGKKKTKLAQVFQPSTFFGATFLSFREGFIIVHRTNLRISDSFSKWLVFNAMVISCTSRLASSTCTCNGAKAAKKTWAFNEEKKDQKLVSDTISPWKSWLLLFFWGGGGGNPCIRKFHGDFYDPLKFWQKKRNGRPSPPRGCCNSIQALPRWLLSFFWKKSSTKNWNHKKTVPWKTPRYLPASQYMTLLKLLYIIYVSKI